MKVLTESELQHFMDQEIALPEEGKLRNQLIAKL
jgi:hypothetical protein